jgi:hypothetical protein
LFGLDPIRDMDRQRLIDLVERALPERFTEARRGAPSVQVREQAATAVRAILRRWPGRAVAGGLRRGSILQAARHPARGSATSSLVAWALGLVELCPLDYGPDAQLFVHQGQGDLPARRSAR